MACLVRTKRRYGIKEGRVDSRRRLKNRRHSAAIANALGPAFAVVYFRIRADPHGVVYRRQHVLGADRVIGRKGADAVASAKDLAAADAATSQNGCGTRAPVFTALLRVD